MPQLVDDRYELVEVLASGGMATVWRARDTRLNRLVALKRPHPAPAESKVPERVAREARAAAGVNHPNLVTVFDTGVDKDGPYLVMELVAGPSLAAPGREIPLEEAISIGAQLADALATVHEAGVVHRDVKPANVILSPDGPRLTDFGIASIEEGTSELTLPGTVLATPSYAAPEVLAGGAPTPASDVFSLAALIYGLIAGVPAFAGTDRSAPPPPLADATIDGLLRPALAAQPERRPPAGELAAGLRGGAPTTAMTIAPTTNVTPKAFGGSTEQLDAIDSPDLLRPSPPTRDTGAEEPRRSSKLVWAGLGLVLLLVGVLALPLFFQDDRVGAVSASTVTSLPIAVALPVTISTEAATTLPPTTTAADNLTQARNQLASALAGVGPPELKPKDEDEILKKVDQAVSTAFDKPEEAAKELGEAANLIRKELDGNVEQESLAAIDGIAAALGLEFSDGDDED